MEKIIENIKEQIETSKNNNLGMDDADWGYEEGILLTPNEALKILEALKSKST